MKFLNHVDFAHRFAVCFFRVGGVSAVFEMAWISLAGPKSHLMSDTVDDFEDEMGDFMDAHGVTQHSICRGTVAEGSCGSKRRNQEGSRKEIDRLCCCEWTRRDEHVGNNGDLRK